MSLLTSAPDREKLRPVRLRIPLSEAPWIPSNRLKPLAALGIVTVEDLLTHYPRRYENRQHFDRFPRDESDRPVCVSGVVTKTAAKRFGRRKIFEVTLEEEDSHAMSQPLILRWFNLHWIQRAIIHGHRLVVFGRPKRRGRQLCIDHPEWEQIENDAEVSIHLRRIAPIHPSGEGLSPRILRTLIFHTLEQVDDLSPPGALPHGLAGPSAATALRDIHFPADEETLAEARRHIVLQEFFAMQLAIAAKRQEQTALAGECHATGDVLLRKFHAQLPFPLTGAQQRTIAEIRRDLSSDRPMNRLLHGEVGSGKTIVALSAMLLTAEAGFQSAIMAPTQILAEQHYLNFKRWLERLGVPIALRTGSRKEESAMPLFDHDAWFQSVVTGKPGPARPSPSEPAIVVGTHALLYEGSSFSNLGLVVIDEQHKFGVMQRASLLRQANAPDVLVMTATPIPRTLAMTLYGDLDVSTLDELPAGRGTIRTFAREPEKLEAVIQFLRDQLDKGRQAYVVYPLIDETEKLNAKAAAGEFERWQWALAPHGCALLHGRVPPDEKEEIMRRFRGKEIEVLVATTVIEVGVDVPNATVMLIENAERFGLAQLHQLRGRIGRGEHKSYCILICGDSNPESMEKLRILETTSNGFEVAEKDLQLRGPGDLLGTAQTGLPPLKLGDLLRDGELMKIAREAAIDIFTRDPHLQEDENQRFREMLVEGRKIVLSQVS
jgi:ATP-dependent DNA helicase RecG